MELNKQMTVQEAGLVVHSKYLEGLRVTFAELSKSQFEDKL